MAEDWVERFKTWAKPPSETEEDKASNAARMINDAVRGTMVLAGVRERARRREQGRVRTGWVMGPRLDAIA